ncbi:MAG: tyrosine-protein phosphatase [Wenzhouxiangella sp.]
MAVDIHCHILPGIDDGSKVVEQSLAMARIAVDDGIETIFATPHHLNGVYRNAAAEIRAAVKALQEQLDEAGIALKLLPGAENHLVPELPRALRDETALTLGGFGRAALVELPVHDIPMGAEELLDNIRGQGIVPIIAHPERNTALRRNPDRLAEWVGAGCLSQVTAQSCTGQFGEGVQAASREMIARGLVHFVASDAHRDRRRIPQISAGRAQIAEWVGEDVAELLGRRFPAALAVGQLPDIDELYEVLPEPRRPWWRRWLGR